LNSFGNWGDFAIGEALRDPTVVSALKVVQQASSTTERIAALDSLMGQIG
jgi:hypothetical protein